MQKQKNKEGRYEALSVTASSSLFVTKTWILNNLNTVPKHFCCCIDLGAGWIMLPLRAYTRLVHCLPISELHVSVNVLESYLLQELCKCT